jgi:hypothetical protein
MACVEDARRDQFCSALRNSCYRSLEKAYQFAIRNQNIATRIFLFYAKQYIRVKPGCLKN